MKQTNRLLLSFITFLILSIFATQTSFAAKIYISDNKQANISQTLSRAEIFEFYGDIFTPYIPESYQYIELYYKDIHVSDPSYEDLQKIVYADLLDNSTSALYLQKPLSAYGFYSIAADLLGKDISEITSETTAELRQRDTNLGDTYIVKKLISGGAATESIQSSDTDEVSYKKQVFFDVYNTLVEKHYDKENLDETRIIEKAIQGLTEGTDDKHTVYFPPVESEGFTQALTGEYEGIGSYVDMHEPGILEIVTPIAGSPSEAAGLKSGDIVTHVDGREVTEKNSLSQVVSWIKGPRGTDVTLTILRNGETKNIIVTRAKITIRDIEYEKLNQNTAYIQMKSFGDRSAREFREILGQIESDTRIRKIIFDLRNNGGGYLGQVSEMLSHFVDSGEKVAVVKYLDYNESIRSRGYDTLDLDEYRVVILQNSGTASASEILIGTLKEYYPHVVVVGEKSYGKGSVQTTKTYEDGSLLKYTIAKWYTGRYQTGIDGVGITPDIDIQLDDERFLDDGYDTQLEKAKDVQ